jgi:hypothetical protein
LLPVFAGRFGAERQTIGSFLWHCLSIYQKNDSARRGAESRERAVDSTSDSPYTPAISALGKPAWPISELKWSRSGRHWPDPLDAHRIDPEKGVEGGFLRRSRGGDCAVSRTRGAGET